MVLRRATLYCVIPEKAALGLPNGSVIAPAAMLAVKLPPKFIWSVNRAVVFPASTVTAVTLGPLLPVTVRSLVVTRPD